MGLRTMLGLKKEKPPRPPLPFKARLPKPESPPNYEAWFNGKEFGTDWLTWKLDTWVVALEKFVDKPVDVLEVGSYEGRSAVALLEYLPKSTVTCIDTFAADDITNVPEDVSVIEARFDANVASYGTRAVKIKQRAAAAMDILHAEGRTFDVIYLDAAKKRVDALAHSALAWPLLKVGGVVIWDDLLWIDKGIAANIPGQGIEMFRDCFKTCITILHEHSQLIAIKKAEWP
jgi:hypothetical protein